MAAILAATPKLTLKNIEKIYHEWSCKKMSPFHSPRGETLIHAARDLPRGLEVTSTPPRIVNLC